MPQVTKRGLVSELRATPTGKGTVYNAMLKTCASHRERAKNLNICEQQRLDKIHKTINKDLHYADWRAEQTISRMRGSLKKLVAFQKVLKEDFPLKQLTNTREKYTLKSTEIAESENAAKSSQSKGDNSRLQRKHSIGSDISSINSDGFTTDVFHARNIQKVRAANERNRLKETQNNNKLHHSEINSTDDNCDKNSYDYFSNQRVKRKVCNDAPVLETPSTRPSVGQVQSSQCRFESPEKYTSNNTRSVSGEYDTSNENYLVQRRKLLHLRDDKDAPSRSNIDDFRSKRKICLNASKPPAQSYRSLVNHNYDNGVTLSRGSDIPDDNFLHSNSQSSFSGLDTTEESRMAGPLTDAQREWHERRLRRKEKVTQKAINRGFDMRTLAWEIDRKLVVMDPDRARRRDRLQMLSESRKDVHRLVSQNQQKFANKIMAPLKQQTEKGALPGLAQQKGQEEESNTLKDGENIINANEHKAKETDAEENSELSPVIETVVMLNPLLHKIPLSY